MRDHSYKYEGRTYKRTRKDKALRLIREGKYYFLVGANVNDFHFHGGWHLATFPKTSDGSEAIETLNAFNFYLDPELGKYPVFYVEV